MSQEEHNDLTEKLATHPVSASCERILRKCKIQGGIFFSSSPSYQHVQYWEIEGGRAGVGESGGGGKWK